MHSNRDAKRIDRRRGLRAVVSASVNPQLVPAYTATTEKAMDARQVWQTLGRFEGLLTSTNKNHYTNFSVPGRGLLLQIFRVHTLSLLNEGTSSPEVFPKKIVES
jgi:hypothetical protein